MKLSEAEKGRKDVMESESFTEAVPLTHLRACTKSWPASDRRRAPERTAGPERLVCEREKPVKGRA